MQFVPSPSLRKLSRSPWFFLSRVGLSIFVAEVLVMVVLGLLPKLSDLAEAVVDATLLSALVAPALYYFLYQPLKAENHERQLIEQQLRRSGEILQEQAVAIYEYSQTLEQQVTDRTAILSAQNLQLEALLAKLHSTQAQIIQSEKMSSLGQLVAGVAHEINNPVSFIHGNLIYLQQYTDELFDLLWQYDRAYPTPTAAIINATEAINLDFLREDLPKLFQSMRHGTDRIRSIILSLRNFSRLDEDGRKTIDLHEGIDGSLMLLQHRLNLQANRPAIQVVKQYGDLVPIDCDAGSLNQVFINLLSNAIDALDVGHPQGEFPEKAIVPTITINTRLVDPHTVAITIGDNGVGIAAAIRDKLFDPFFTTKPVGQGTGLGLSISYTIVTETHGGKLWFDSTPGQGSKFVIELPIVAVNPSSPIRISATR
jgi:signal transduction histidine kinase